MGTGEEYSRNREMDHKDPEARVSVAPQWNHEIFTVAGEQEMMG